MRPLAGDFAYLLFALGLVNAALLSATILPLATAYNICEGLGAESGVNKWFSEAPVFYWLFTFLIVGGAGIVLIPQLPLLKFILFSQVANGARLPFLLVFMLILVNRKDDGRLHKLQPRECDCVGNEHHHHPLNNRNDLDYRIRTVVVRVAGAKASAHLASRARNDPRIAINST